MSTDGAPDILGQILAADVDEEVLQAMSTRAQRYTLYHFLNHERATLDELADALAGWMATTEDRVTTSVDRSSLRISLFHNHLPQLADIELLSFDPEHEVADRSPLSAPERELVESAYAAEHWTAE